MYLHHHQSPLFGKTKQEEWRVKQARGGFCLWTKPMAAPLDSQPSCTYSHSLYRKNRANYPTPPQNLSMPCKLTFASIADHKHALLLLSLQRQDVIRISFYVFIAFFSHEPWFALYRFHASLSFNVITIGHLMSLIKSKLTIRTWCVESCVLLSLTCGF